MYITHCHHITLSSAVNVLIVIFILFDTFGYLSKEILFYFIVNLCKPNLLCCINYKSFKINEQFQVSVIIIIFFFFF